MLMLTLRSTLIKVLRKRRRAFLPALRFIHASEPDTHALPHLKRKIEAAMQCLKRARKFVYLIFIDNIAPCLPHAWTGIVYNIYSLCEFETKAHLSMSSSFIPLPRCHTSTLKLKVSLLFLSTDQNNPSPVIQCFRRELQIIFLVLPFSRFKHFHRNATYLPSFNPSLDFGSA